MKQRKLFIREFKKLIVSIYSIVFITYDEDQIKFYPARSETTNQKEVIVESIIIDQNEWQVSN
ncbi:ABC transporter substrate-binding protein [Coxiella endosymbiont of Dermacentor marginatus]|uniref:ABC transporter substrate-binding protein n=1 Tax=Coxiella endosymbiont of Dermacentor marginatus TaxID=1656159 RepID=UPI003872CD8B